MVLEPRLDFIHNGVPRDFIGIACLEFDFYRDARFVGR